MRYLSLFLTATPRRGGGRSRPGWLSDHGVFAGVGCGPKKGLEWEICATGRRAKEGQGEDTMFVRACSERTQTQLKFGPEMDPCGQKSRHTSKNQVGPCFPPRRIETAAKRNGSARWRFPKCCTWVWTILDQTWHAKHTI